MKSFLVEMLPKHWAARLRHLKNYQRLRRKQLQLSASRIESQRGTPKIVYALTPPPGLSNIGDHAQVVAIHRWIKRYFPDHPVLEIDKNDCTWCVPEIESAVTRDDLILLHSGGNLGDRGIWSERARRNMIKAFPNQPVVSLPQTIHFSDTPYGRHEREATRRIYATHPALTVLARDERSGEIAKDLFPKATLGSMPDFVLSVTNPPEPKQGEGVLLCLRNDDESALSAAQRQQLHDLVGGKKEEFDTTIEEPIAEDQREEILDSTLDYFAGFEAVITDRYHGLIFSVLCQRPTVVLGTVDHKLTSAFDWFGGIRGLRFASSVEEVPALLEEVRAEGVSNVPDWNNEYFSPFGERVQALAKAHAPSVWG